MNRQRVVNASTRSRFCSTSSTLVPSSLEMADTVVAMDSTSDGWMPSLGSSSRRRRGRLTTARAMRSEEHTSELQSPCNLVCRLLLEKKKIDRQNAFDGGGIYGRSRSPSA